MKCPRSNKECECSGWSVTFGAMCKHPKIKVLTKGSGRGYKDNGSGCWWKSTIPVREMDKFIKEFVNVK